MKQGYRALMGALGVVALAAALALLAAAGQGAQAQSTIIYVDADSPGEVLDGTSWEEAFVYLGEALDAAESGDQIWVAEGTYKPPMAMLYGRYATFQMKDRVAIYGGFDPTVGDDTWEERNWADNVTILSGDIGIPDDPSDNSYHVFYHPMEMVLDETAILDGFSVTGGNADDDEEPHAFGGGMLNFEGASPTIANCTFTSNFAEYGGGMLNGRSSPELVNVTFEDNQADSRGGGIYNYQSTATLVNVGFDRNSAGYEGGGIFNDESSPTLVGCTFRDNEAYYGGGMYNVRSSLPTLTDCTFADNAAIDDGGGIYNSESSPSLSGCTFSGNSADDDGGGIYNQDSWPTLTDCIFEDNHADEGGGAYNEHSSPTLANCTFAGNVAHIGRGGGMANYDSSSPVLTNCVFWSNRAEGGGAMYSSYSMPTLTNCIVWSNWPDQISFESSLVIVNYSDVHGGYPGDSNIASDPLFVDPDNGDFHLGAGSPCIDAGNNAAPSLPEYDFEGDDRVVDGDLDGVAKVDMGADEALPQAIFLPLVLRGS